jgi:uncharacterized membrane protein
MLLLALIALVCIPVSFCAVPLFEGTVVLLLLAPILWFLLGSVFEAVDLSLLAGWLPFCSYLLIMVALIVVCRFISGRRRTAFSWGDFTGLFVFSVFFVAAYIYALSWPDFIALGERLRDYSILASTISSPLDPKEPWLAGGVLNYYVYWYRFAHFISTVLFLPPWEVYHAMTAFAIALYGAVVFEILRVVCKLSLMGASVGGLVAAFGSNVAGFLMVIYPEPTYWGPSRVVKGAINEFPAWSFIHGDLHPHFLNLPALPLFVLIMFRLMQVPMGLQVRVVSCVSLLVVGGLFMMAANAWEVPLWGAVMASIGVVWLHGVVSIGRRRYRPLQIAYRSPQLIQGAGAVIALVFALLAGILLRDKVPAALLTAIVAVGICTFLGFFPWKAVPCSKLVSLLDDVPLQAVVTFMAFVGIGLWLQSRHIIPEGATPRLVGNPIPLTLTSEVFTHFGFFLIPMALGSVLLLSRPTERVFAIAFLALSLCIRDGAVFIIALLGLHLARLVHTTRRTRVSIEEIFTDGIALAGLGLVLAPEILFLDDPYGGENERMNTIFKIYTVAWGLLCIGGIGLFARGCSSFGRSYICPRRAPHVRAVAVTFACMAIVGMTMPFFFSAARLRKPGFAPPGVHEPASRGLNEIEARFPGSATIIERLREEPHVVVLEAQGNAYDYTTFVSTLAGQTAYLGWANHINLLTKRLAGKGQVDIYAEVRRREQLTQQLYNDSNCQSRKEVARGEGINFIVVGVREKEKYINAAQSDFSCFEEVAKDKEYTLYRS